MRPSRLVVAGLVAVASALPYAKKMHQLKSVVIRHQKLAAESGLKDLDIVQFALTLERLETRFYKEAFEKIPDADFTGLGLSNLQIQDLKGVGRTEAIHVEVLKSAVQQMGAQPVQDCEYEFGLTDAAGMVVTAGVLEQVGVSAYLGAAPLVSDAATLKVAASILPVEARHQTLVRAVSRVAAAPSAFETPLGVRAVFSLAAPFIKSCPEGSNLPIQPFPTLALADSANPANVSVGASIRFDNVPENASHCAFVNGDLPAESAFAPFDRQRGCVVPRGLTGIGYVFLAREDPGCGGLTDDITVAGPVVLPVS